MMDSIKREGSAITSRKILLMHILFFCFLTFVSPGTHGKNLLFAEDATLTLENNSCLLKIKAGNIVHISNKITGEKIADTPETDSSACYLPVGIGDIADLTWLWRNFGQHAILNYPGCHRPGISSKTTLTEEQENKKSIAWQGLETPKAGIVYSAGQATQKYPEEEFSLSLETSRKTDEIMIVARGTIPGGSVKGVSFGITGIPDTHEIIVPAGAGLFFHRNNISELYRTAFRLGAAESYSWDSPLVIIQGEKGGCMLWNEDSRFAPKQVGIEHKDGLFNLVLDASMDEGSPAETFISPPWRFAVYKGDWTVPAGIYKEAMVKRLNLQPISDRKPAWFRDIRVIGNLSKESVDGLSGLVDPKTVLIVSQDSRLNRTFPDNIINPEWVPQLEYAKSKGFRVIGFSSYRFIAMPGYPRFDRSHYKCPEKRPDCICITRFGGPEKFYKKWGQKPYMYNRYGGKDQPLEEAAFGFVHMGWSEWRNFLLELHKEIYEKYGLDGWYFDTAGNIGLHPYGPVEGLNEVMGERIFFKQLHSIIPETVFMTEDFDETVLGSCLLCWNIGFSPSSRVHPISGYLYGDFFKRWCKTITAESLAGTEASGGISSMHLGDEHPSTELAKSYALLHSKLSSYFPEKWEKNVLAYHKDKDGNVVKFTFADNHQQMVKETGGKKEVLLGLVTGCNKATLPAGAVIGRWLAYEGEKAIGLLPERVYPYFLRGKTDEEKKITVTKLPQDTAITEIRQVRAGDEIMPFRKYERDAYTFIELKSITGNDTGGMVSYASETKPALILLSDGKVIVPEDTKGNLDIVLPGAATFVWSEKELLPGKEFNSNVVQPTGIHFIGMDGFDRPKTYPHNSVGVVAKKKIGDTERTGRLARPVSSNKESAMDWLLQIPSGRPVLQFHLGYSESRTKGKTMRYLVRINGKTVFDETVGDVSEWQKYEIDLTEWQGKPVLLSLVTDSRSGQCGSMSAGMWADAKITVKE